MEDEPEIARRVGADERAAIHHAGEVFQALRELDVIHLRVDLRERAEHVVRRDALLVRRVAFRIEGLGVRPENLATRK